MKISNTNTYQDILYTELSNTLVKISNVKKCNNGLASKNTRKNFARKNKRLFKLLTTVNRLDKSLPTIIKG